MDELVKIDADRFLRKDPNQSDQTKGAAYAAMNPAQKRGDDSKRKAGQTKGSEEDDGAPNILTGTVIVSCFIQTSALPSRIELEGNDITFFDDTYSEGGVVVGDTSRLVFTHGSGKRGEIITQGFIMEKRASIRETYDNVLSWYATPARTGYHNNMFIGRNGSPDPLIGDDEGRHVNSLFFGIDRDTTALPSYPFALNGTWGVEYSEDGEFPFSTARPFAGGASDGVLGVPGQTGFSALMSAGEGGGLYWMYQNTSDKRQWDVLLAADNTGVFFNISMIPAVASTYDIGSVAVPVRAIYADTINADTINADSIVMSGPPVVSLDHITGPGAISVATAATGITTTGIGDAFTLANGVDGQVKYIFIDADGGTAVITPATANGFTTVTLNADGDGVTLIYSTLNGWNCVGENSATFA